MLKQPLRAVEKRGLNHVLDERGKPRRYKAWLGDCLAFLYDRIMEKSVFPRTLGSDMDRHFAALGDALAGVHGQRVLDVAAGTGSLIRCLPADNEYWGTDISPGLLRRAHTRLRGAGFKAAALYVAPAHDLPFADGAFDRIVCNLSLNFFDDLDAALGEWSRVLADDGHALCSVPVPERNQRQSKISGTLRSEDELRAAAGRNGFTMETLPVDNGAVLYFGLTKGREQSG